MGDLLTGATKEILNKLLSFAIEELKLVWGFKGDAERLRRKLQRTQALLHDAESHRLPMETVQVWLKDLKIVACDADDVLDECAYEVLRRKLENRMGDKVCNFFSPSNPLAFRLKMANKIKKIVSSLDEIYSEASEIGLRPVEFVQNTVEPRETLQTHPFVDDTDIVGRESDVSKVVDKLVRSDNEVNLPAIAIVGMAGLGKTTVAQLVYNDVDVVKNFEKRMWVCVSDNFTVERLLNEMAESLGGTKLGVSNIEEMIKQLREKVSGKRFLLVLDDVWSEDNEKWNYLRNSLVGVNGERGSKILVTTRSDGVVSAMQPSSSHPLGELSLDDSWTMFEKRAFAFGGPIQTPQLVAIGKRIAKRCRGVPLAIKIVGGLMYSKKDEDEWLSIQDNEIWNSPEIHDNHVLRALRLSFNHLPSSALKQCFAHCSLFLKDDQLKKNDVIQRWMAQGFLQPAQGRNSSMEEVGNSYFNILLRNSFLQDVEKDEYGNITSCKMHDLVHDLALDVSKSFCITSTTGEVAGVAEILHLSLISGPGGVKKIPKERARRLRTLRLFEVNPPNDALKDFKGLRELDVLVFCSGTENFPKLLGRMKHLRYLDASWSNIKSLPRSFCKFYNLQTLNVSRCTELKEFPQDFCKLVGMRHLYMDKSIMTPVGIGKLTSLQTLQFFGAGRDNGRRIEELGCLSNLRGELEIYDLENVANRAEAEKAKLSSKLYIQVLKFKWSSEREVIASDKDVLEGLKPNQNVKGLKIENFRGENFASWMMTIPSPPCVLDCLVKIELENCHKCKQVPPLGHLPRLEVVKIDGMENLECIGVEFYGRVSPDGATVGVFPSLRHLILRKLPNLVKWLEADDAAAAAAAFPCLEELKIEYCEKLIAAPGHFPAIKKLGIEELNSGQALEKMSNTITTLEDLYLGGVSGSEVNLVLERMLVNSRLLTSMNITSCKELSYLPDGLGNLAYLSRVFLWKCPNLTCLPNGLHLPVSLEILAISSCPKLVVANPDPHKPISLLNDVFLLGFETLTNDWARFLLSLTGLRQLGIGRFSEELDYFPWWPTPPPAVAAPAEIKEEDKEDDDVNTHTTTSLFCSLESLSLYGWEKVESLPEQLQHLTDLKTLALFYFDGLESLPEWLGNLSSLQFIQITRAKKLKNLQVMRSLINLRLLIIEECPLLKERCKKEVGPEWPNIAHIPSIEIDDVEIQ